MLEAKAVEVADTTSIGVDETGEVVDAGVWTTIEVDEAVGVPDGEDCVTSGDVEKDAAPGDDVVLDEGDEGSIGLDEDAVDGDDDGGTEGAEIIESDVAVDEDDGDELAVCAEEKLTSDMPTAAAINIPPTMPIRNEFCFMDC